MQSNQAQQPIIDTHHHLWALDGSIGYDWLEQPPFYNDFLGDYSGICRPFLPKDLHDLIPKDYQLLASVHCEAECRRSDWSKEIAWIDQTAKDCWLSNKVAMVQSVWADILDEDFVHILDHLTTVDSVRGIRFKPRVQSQQIFDERWHKALDMMTCADLLWELRVPSQYLGQAYTLLQSHQALKVVINHCGLPWDRSGAGLRAWTHSLEKLSTLPNCYIKLSELKAPNKAWDYQENLTILNLLLQSFDPKKAMFASNAPVSLVNCGYEKWLYLVEEAIGGLGDAVRQAILWQTAQKVYRIGLPFV